MFIHELRWYRACSVLGQGRFFIERRYSTMSNTFQTPRGTYDILPDEMGKWHDAERIMREVSDLYRYQEIRTPYFELTKVFDREGDSSDMVNKEMYSFRTKEQYGEQSESYTLRPEGTAGTIRAFDQHKMYATNELPVRLYYLGPMFRHERPQKGRQRQFTQYGVEALGIKSPQLDAEVIALGVDIIKAVGIKSVKVAINTLGDDDSRAAYRQALKDYFAPHIDELCEDCHRRYEQNPLRILDCKVDGDNPVVLNAPKLSDYLTPESKAYFDEVLKSLESLGIDYEVDDRLVRGLDYYTDTVFEIISVRPESGKAATVCGGGRYDHFIDYYGGPELSGIGFAFGVERLLTLAVEEGHVFNEDRPLDAYIISLGETGSIPLQVAQELRHAGLTAEVNFVPRSLKSQFKSSDRKGAKYVVIIGETEAAEGKVNLKRPGEKEQITVDRKDLVRTIEGME
ncbi:MAG: histidine--tRNA ligase [Solobacterium sp.]|nr:histidine--tRNA ligase [Solobacterium sp.]MBQ6592495.1 histidine--tRNA ligase [Solobacterium sp.]MBR2727023.1 histidine--tRNA ligase [Solobacterium sp.]